MLFFHGKDSSFNARHQQKCFFHWTSTGLEIWVENFVSAIQHIENKKCFTEVLPPINSYGQNAYLEETVKSSQPEFYANASLSSAVLCLKHTIFMCLGEYLAKL